MSAGFIEPIVVANPFDFSGATAVVLGGATGLGRAMAGGLASHGAEVCIVSRSEDKARGAADAIATEHHRRCHARVADVASEASVKALAASLAELFPSGVNIAVNSSGINVRHPIQDIALEEWESIQRVNSTGAFLFAREMRPLFKRAGWGRLIHVTSIFASRSFPGRTSYASSKGALLQLTRTLAIEWAGENITANTISPGPFLTEMTQPILDNPEAYRRFCGHVPLGRFAQPHEIVTACLFLASPASTYVTGAEIVVDGGWLTT